MGWPWTWASETSCHQLASLDGGKGLIHFILVLLSTLSPETQHWNTLGKMLKKSCIFTKFFHSFFSQKNTHIIYNLFNFYFWEKYFFFFMEKLIKSEFKCLIFISILYKIKFIVFHCFTHIKMIFKWSISPISQMFCQV